eukprot:7132794-Alexandrium_andersonii.AAC.1
MDFWVGGTCSSQRCPGWGPAARGRPHPSRVSAGKGGAQLRTPVCLHRERPASPVALASQPTWPVVGSGSLRRARRLPGCPVCPRGPLHRAARRKGR